MKKQNGITLVALVVTIILLLILASIGLSSLNGNNNLINRAENAKESSETAEEKEIIDIATTKAMGKNKYGTLIQSDLQESINEYAKNDEKIEVMEYENGLLVYFQKSNKYYLLNEKGEPFEYKPVVDSNPGNIKIGMNGEGLLGDENSPFEIWSIEDLVEWSQNYSTYQTSFIKLGRTLNFDLKFCYTDGKMLGCTTIDELKTLLTNREGNGFTPILRFGGTFDGQGFEIQNIYMNRSSGVASLFKAAGGVIKNLGITGEIISQTGHAASICGYLGQNDNLGGNSLSIINCYNKANVTSLTGRAGGLIGEESIVDILVLNSFNTGNITGKTYSGGIIGYAGKGSVSIYNSYNLGSISAENAGGFMGGKYHNVTTKFYNCYNHSNQISGTTNEGEFIGYNYANGVSSSAEIKNVLYFDKNYSVNKFYNGTPIYFEDITSDEIITNLNSFIENYEDADFTKDWKKWKKGILNYPTLDYSIEWNGQTWSE